MANSLHDKLLSLLNRAPGDDYFITGGASRSAANDNLLAASGSAAIDTMATGNLLGSAHSFYVQVNASSGISAGAIIFEGSNDNSNFVTLGYVDSASPTSGSTAATAVTIAASTQRFFEGRLTYRYFRVRVSTAFVGGTVSATARLSTAQHPRNDVVQGTVNSLKVASYATPQGSGGNSVYSGAVSNTATQVKSGAGQVYGWDIHNPNAAIAYVQFFNAAVGSVTVGTTAPVYSIGIPANSRAVMEWPNGIQHTTAIVVAATTTRAGGTAPSSAVDVNVIYT